MKLPSPCAALLIIVSLQAHADSLDINMNNTSAQFKAGISASGLGEGNAEIQGRLLYNDSGDQLVDVGPVVQGPGGGGEDGGGAPGTIAGGGLRFLVANSHQPGATYTLACLTLGAEFGFALPTSVPLAIIADYAGSPKILSFADAERYNQYGIRLEFGASQKAKIYFGYREVGFGVKNFGSIILDKGSHVGLSIAF